MKLSGIIFLCLFFLLAFSTCKKPYSPDIVSTDQSYLVVEGVINSGSDSTFITLSRTIKLDSTKNVSESGAVVTVESNKGDIYPLSEVKTGIYSTANLNLPTDRNFHIHIITSNGKEYISDYEPNKITPPIDSVSYQIQTPGVQFYVTSHDPQNGTRYYRWDYDETWTYFSLYTSQYIYTNHQLEFRNPDSLVNTCYRHAMPSNSFYVDKTDQLSQDVVAQFPIGFISPFTSDKLTHVYSLNVKQYAITPDAFLFWQNLKKNTEQLGSIFDAFPSTALGNIHCLSNSKEPVLGFISISTVTSKRIFLSGRTLPYHFPSPPVDPPHPSECYAGVIPVEPQATLPARLERTLGSGDTLATVAIVSKITHLIIGYSYATKVCVDCRVIGGTNIKPSYWPFGL